MKKYLLGFAVVLIVAFAAFSVFAENEALKTPVEAEQSPAPAVAPMTPPAATPAAIAAPAATSVETPVKEEAPKPAELSIYGETQSVNAQANSMVVQYYDYDNDEEKSTEVTLDANSKLENAKAIADIKKGDWVDITYTTVAGKNIAKVVSVEKEEPAQEENSPAIEE